MAEISDTGPPAFADQVMHAALAEAAKAATEGEVPVGAVVYDLTTGRIVAAAHNRRETDADPTAHAEILALRAAARIRGLWRLEIYGLAVTLEPCPMCAGALVNARLGQLLYGATDPKMGCVDTLHTLCREPRFNHRLPTWGNILAEESATLLRDFFRQRRSSSARSNLPER